MREFLNLPQFEFNVVQISGDDSIEKQWKKRDLLATDYFCAELHFVLQL